MSSILDCGRGLFDEIVTLKACRPALGCLPEFDASFAKAIHPCIPEFYKLCDFDRLIRVCPFDPAWDAFEWKQRLVSDRLQELEVQVKELQAKVQTHK